jgi:superfamily II RNA helicase
MKEFHGLELDRFQEEAIESIDQGHSCVVAAPTGCGKTLIAEYAIEKMMEQGVRVFYTGPIKALSNQKFRDFSARYGVNKVGIVTGDVRMNSNAPIVVMTTEIFRNSLFDGVGGSLKDVCCVILDEVHYLGDAERGTVWEESIIFAPEHIRFVCLSATVPNARQFTDWIANVRGETVDYIVEPTRPVPLKHYMYMANQIFDAPQLKGLVQKAQQFKKKHMRYKKERDVSSLVQWVNKQRKMPALYFCFNRKECEAKAQSLSDIKLLTAQESEKILNDYELMLRRLQIDPDLPTANEVRDLVERGIAYHHAGLLPTMKDIVEQLFASGQIKLLICTETFAMGVNMPAATVIFDALKKFNGVSVDWLKVREYTQMAGRAGRRGMDASGTVISLVEPRDCDMAALKHIVSNKVEALESSFNLSYGSLCNLVGRVGGQRVFETLEKSFVHYCQKNKRKKGLGRLRNTLTSRLGMLEKFGYVKDFELTPRGEMAGRINGFEIMGCEWYFSGALNNLKDESLAILFMAAVFESRRGDWYKQPNWEGIHADFFEAANSIHLFREAEEEVDLSPLRELDFKFSQAVLHWYEGGSFAEFSEFTSAGEGDIVRHFLLCCQFLRQMSRVVEDKELGDRLKTVRSRLFRGVMDAEAQLRLSCEAEDEPDL